LIPASHDPDVSTVPPLYAFVASPKYQTFPARSWAYQSVVLSSSVPPWVAAYERGSVGWPVDDRRVGR
jgi:hypothetical protein